MELTGEKALFSRYKNEKQIVRVNKNSDAGELVKYFNILTCNSV